MFVQAVSEVRQPNEEPAPIELAVQQGNDLQAPLRLRASEHSFNPLDTEEVNQLIRQKKANLRCPTIVGRTAIVATFLIAFIGLILLPVQTITNPPTSGIYYGFPVLLSGLGSTALTGVIYGSWSANKERELKVLNALNTNPAFINYLREENLEGETLRTNLETIVKTYKDFQILQQNRKALRQN